jgi:hypothetical protein
MDAIAVKTISEVNSARRRSSTRPRPTSKDEGEGKQEANSRTVDAEIIDAFAKDPGDR